MESYASAKISPITETVHWQFDSFGGWNTVLALRLDCIYSAEHWFLEFMMLAEIALSSMGDENMGEKEGNISNRGIIFFFADEGSIQ